MERNSTWTPEDGYKNPMGPHNYPVNTMGGIFGDKLLLVLNQKLSDSEHLCTFFKGFKVILTVFFLVKMEFYILQLFSCVKDICSFAK